MKTNLTDLTKIPSTVQTEAPRMLLAILSLLIVGLMINPKVEIAEVPNIAEVKDQTPEEVAVQKIPRLNAQVAKTR